MVDFKPMFRGHLLQIPVAQLIEKIPADVGHYDRALKTMTSIQLKIFFWVPNKMQDRLPGA